MANMLPMTVKLKGAEKLIKILQHNNTIGKPVASGLKRIALWYTGQVKKATVVDTGRLRSSITQQVGPTSAVVGTNVQYAQYVEYGTEKMASRHMEGSTKVLGQGGMFEYAKGLLKSWLDKGEHKIHSEIEKRFK